jgi:hypothetical protein
LPNIYASGFKERNQAERQSVNSICQGSAADIAKKAMVDVTRAMRTRQLQSRLVLQLHDELLFEVSQDELDFFLVCFFSALFVFIVIICVVFVHFFFFFLPSSRPMCFIFCVFFLPVPVSRARK